MENVESVAKAALEKLKEMNMVENAKEIVKRTTLFVPEYARILFDWLLENLKQIIVKTPPFVRTSSHWLLKNAKEIVVKTTPFVRTSSDWLLEKALPLISTSINSIRIAPLYYTIPIGFLLILFLRRCCSGGGDDGGNGKTMKAPGRNNVRIHRRDFDKSPKSYFRDLRYPKKIFTV
uniref:Putative ovule protein n=1 Tax=Solanum chacoense TaxID=4108 RepID=A0A0V0GV14_SOLCH